ncbi:hypothetical protein SAMN05421544_11529 [Riemerella columbipharyngis]|uniref:Uncharacterized protein n=1 Tax=Riemerella columbipharyngis TaxID=1071918 RepID=A0A1G7ECY9_9FLAO|nr:hypothetical protein SAMN05421544_11529 [Riemerella columbipharyngis]
MLELYKAIPKDDIENILSFNYLWKNAYEYLKEI